MKQRFINVECFCCDGSKRGDFSVDHASVDALMAVLQLAKVGDVVSITIHEEEIQFNPNRFAASPQDV